MEAPEQPPPSDEGVAATPVQQEGESLAWQQIPAHCFYSPSGFLRVVYGDAAQQKPWEQPTTPPYQGNAYSSPYMTAAPTPYYTAEAVASSGCALCKRTFANANAVLHHLKDHKAHHGSPEALEAAYLLQCEEAGYAAQAGGWGWAPNESFADAAPWPQTPVYSYSGQDVGGFEEQVFAPPSDVYTGSDSSSAVPLDEAAAYEAQRAAHMALQQQRGLQEGSMSERRRVGRRGGPGRKGGAYHNGFMAPPKPPAPRPEDYDAAFPPLAGAGPAPAPASVAAPLSTASRKWGAVAAAQPASNKLLRAEAQVYTPMSPAPSTATSLQINTEAPSEAATQALSSAAASMPSTPHSSSGKPLLRADAPAWEPPAAAAEPQPQPRAVQEPQAVAA